MKFDLSLATQFNTDKGQITINEFIDFLIDQLSKGVPKNAKICVNGLNEFYFHYDTEGKRVWIDNDAMEDFYESGSDDESVGIISQMNKWRRREVIKNANNQLLRHDD